MISSVKQAIVNKLLELYPTHTIYDEDIPQSFKKPSFLINLYDQDYKKRLNTKNASQLSFDIAYFSNKLVTEVKEDCQGVQLNLLRGFDLIGTFRVFNKRAQTVDNVLHLTFDIRYSESKDEALTAMQTKTTNTTI
jgi:hypothetical protein